METNLSTMRFQLLLMMLLGAGARPHFHTGFSPEYLSWIRESRDISDGNRNYPNSSYYESPDGDMDYQGHNVRVRELLQGMIGPRDQWDVVDEFLERNKYISFGESLKGVYVA